MGLVRIDNTNLENGIINRNAAHIFGSMGQLDPTKYHTIFEDFDPYFNPDNATETNLRYIEAIGGTGSVENDPSLGSAVALETSDSSSDVTLIRRINEGNQVRVGYPLYYRFKGNLPSVTLTSLLIGLTDGNNTDLTPEYGLYFFVSNNGTTFSLIYDNNSVATQVDDIATVPVDTEFTLEFFWDGTDRVYYGMDETTLGYLDLSSSTLTNTGLAHTIAIRTGEAAIKSLTADYVFSAQER